MESNDYTCRICLEDNCPRNTVIAPCACKGSSKWVHRKCLDSWRCTKEKAFSKCTECHQNYRLISTVEDTPKHRRQRQIEYICYVCRDITAGILLLFLLISLFALIVWSLDKSLINQFHASKYPYLFYLLAGFVLLLAIFGLLFMTHAICGRQMEECHCCPNGSCLDVYFISSYDSQLCCTCCCDQSCGAMECGAGTLSGEIVLVLFFIFAIIGLILAVFAGIILVQQIIVKHMHILQKRGLAQDYQVDDLAANDIESNDNILNESEFELTNRSTDKSIFSSQNDYQYSAIRPINSPEHMDRDIDFRPSAPYLPINNEQTQRLLSLGLL